MSLPMFKILMITPYYRQQRGNSLTSSRLKCGLESRGFSIDLVSLEENQALSELESRLKTCEYSLAHVFHAGHLATVLDKIPDLHNLPLILTTTGTDINIDMQGNEKNRLNKAFQAADRIVVFHEDFCRLIGGIYPELKSKLTVIPQGISLPEGAAPDLGSYGLTEDNFIFLLPSGLRPVKNITLAIDALTKIQPEYPELRLLIAGADLNPEYSRAIKQRISHLAWVKYIGEVPHEQIGGLMKLAHVVLNSSHAEGQPQAVLEAMSLAKPCIMTAVPGNLHIIGHGREGFYITNEEDFAEAARVLITNPELCQEMGQAAQQLVEKDFSLTRELDAYTALYAELLPPGII